MSPLPPQQERWEKQVNPTYAGRREKIKLLMDIYGNTRRINNEFE